MINSTLLNLYNMGVISNEDNHMQWKSPFGQYIFDIKRYEPDNKFGNNYRIEVNITNNLGVFVTKLSFNEIDCVRILDCMNWLLYDTEYQSFSNIYIGVSTEANLDYKSIFLEIQALVDDNFYIDDHTLNPIYYCDKYDDIRDIEFKILNYNPLAEQQVPILSFNISAGELNDLMFVLYFTCLIDIEIPPSEEAKLENVIHGMIVMR